ncbi:hypothetical protein A2765_02295 [Candidatus Kaiserbacteria bacterium RIFCSPHIGHO2_01_FULL_56_24]|uniref:Uncharacterized protein n=1 Tax=Candidatus Kaiserbacteria bacterium RIFCSPHIGHO2_01_FULL_56_24 TaxID=1798487 RepID=A0A1F6DAX1_9BACT|nr:MAG: hypothetical protein A2765_02295 [Candidatus Kaiserbacteria bacterium RIFCSPHIGHO2_01_FULL_56_24]
MNPQDTELQQQLEERLKTLPQAVQNAIASSDLEKRLRELSDKQKLHIDQWQKLENEVMLTLLGFQQAENLENNLIREVGVTAEIARALAENINTIVFEPIRQELERQLEHPAAQEATVSAIEATRATALAGVEKESPAPVPQPAVAPATPPQAPPAANVVRMPASGAYKPGEASTQRASVVDDPYREPPQ